MPHPDVISILLGSRQFFGDGGGVGAKGGGGHYLETENLSFWGLFISKKGVGHQKIFRVVGEGVIRW